jgi:hypothetical protein
VLKKVILCGAVLLSFSDADSMNFRPSKHSEAEKRLVIQIGDAYRAQNPEGCIPWTDLLQENGIDSDPRWASSYYSRPKGGQENYGALSEGERQQIIQIGAAYRAQNPDGRIPWTTLFQGTGLNPVRAAGCYFAARRQQLRLAEFIRTEFIQSPAPLIPVAPPPVAPPPVDPEPLFDQDAWELPEFPFDPFDPFAPDGWGFPFFRD